MKGQFGLSLSLNHVHVFPASRQIFSFHTSPRSTYWFYASCCQPDTYLTLAGSIKSAFYLMCCWRGSYVSFQVNVFMIRVTNFPILLLIALYERQTKKAGTTSFYDTLCHMGEKVICVLPRPLTRLCEHSTTLLFPLSILIYIQQFLKVWLDQEPT